LSRAFCFSGSIAKKERPHTKRRAFIRRRLVAVAVVAKPYTSPLAKHLIPPT
jgi:hypothetical protein